jgi:hypothetical protein
MPMRAELLLDVTFVELAKETEQSAASGRACSDYLDEQDQLAAFLQDC